ncbi:MAG: class I SAM-dependent methyltransferase [Candidatus Woesearchaeota archaeon]
MNLAKFLSIKSEYDKFYNQLLSRGRLPLKDTGVGYWSMSVADDLYTLFQRLRLQNYKRFIDIGSGDGKAVMVASLFTSATGIEIDKELHDKAQEIKKRLKIKANLLNGDYHEHNLKNYDIIFYYPDSLNHKLELKLANELNGKLIVYGPHYHPTMFKHDMSFIAHSTPVSIFSRNEF